MIIKKYTVIKIERLYPFMYLIELEPIKPTTIDIKPEKKPETDEEKYVLRMIKALVTYGVIPSPTGVIGNVDEEKKPLFRDNNLEIIVDKLAFTVGDEIELRLKYAGIAKVDV